MSWRSVSNNLITHMSQPSISVDGVTQSTQQPSPLTCTTNIQQTSPIMTSQLSTPASSSPKQHDPKSNHKLTIQQTLITQPSKLHCRCSTSNTYRLAFKNMSLLL
jgi:hypothetical protein